MLFKIVVKYYCDMLSGTYFISDKAYVIHITSNNLESKQKELVIKMI